MRFAAAGRRRVGAGLHAGVVLGQPAAGRQAIRELGVERVDRRAMLDRRERRARADDRDAPRAGCAETLRPDAARRNRATGMPSSASRRCVAHAGVNRRQRAQLIPHTFGIGRAPVVAQLLRQSEDDRRGRRATALRAAWSAAHAARAARSTSRCPQLRRPRRRREARHPRCCAVPVRNRSCTIKTVETSRAGASRGADRPRTAPGSRRSHRAHATSPRSIASNISDRCQPFAGGTVTPHARSNFARTSSFSTCWKPGNRSGSAPMSPPPCTLFWPAQRVDPGAPAADMAGQQAEVDEGEHVVDRRVMLGDAERPADHRARRRWQTCARSRG